VSKYKLIIFDLDGTLVETRTGSVCRTRPDDWLFKAGVTTACLRLRKQGVQLAIATNQGAVAFGYLQEEAVRREVFRAANAIGVSAVAMCFTHPQATLERYRELDPRRKPGPGMLQEIMSRSGADPSQTLMVGDRPEDKAAAAAADVAFAWAHEFFAGKEQE